MITTKIETAVTLYGSAQEAAQASEDTRAKVYPVYYRPRAPQGSGKAVLAGYLPVRSATVALAEAAGLCGLLTGAPVQVGGRITNSQGRAAVRDALRGVQE